MYNSPPSAITGPATAQKLEFVIELPCTTPSPCNMNSSPRRVMITPVTIRTGFYMSSSLTAPVERYR